MPVLVLLTSLAVFGQEPAPGVIAGTVLDASDLAIPGATVTAFRQDETLAGTVVTSSNGSFILSLPSGRYTVRATLQGFRPAGESGIELRSEARVDLRPFRLRVARGDIRFRGPQPEIKMLPLRHDRRRETN